MADTLSSLSVLAFVFAGVFFAAAIVLFVVLKIPKVIDYFTNRSAKKSVKRMVSTGGAASKIPSFQTSAGNKARGKLTEQVEIEPPPKRKTAKLTVTAPPQPSGTSGERPETGLLTEKDEHTAYLDPAEKLEVDLAPETEQLDEYATSVLPETIAKVAGNRPRIELTKLDEVMFTHTNEVIP